MFGFGKKQASPPPAIPPAPPPTVGDIYVMPEKYLLPAASGGSKGLIIASLVLVAVIIVTAGVVIYDWASRQTAVVQQPALTPPIIELEMPPAEEEASTETIATTTVATTTDQSAAATTPTTTVETANQPNQISLDTDGDGLTDVEEAVLGALANKADTDGDGYNDGLEVANGYSPTIPGSARLSETPSIVSLTSDFAEDNYSLIYPKEWTASLVKTAKQLLITAGSGEVIKATIRENQGGLSPLAWYLQDHPEVAVSQLKIVSTQDGQLSGIFSPDGLSAYLTDSAKTKFYVFEYLSSRQAEIRYPAIFAAIIKNLKVLPVAAAEPASATATTTE